MQSEQKIRDSNYEYPDFYRRREFLLCHKFQLATKILVAMFKVINFCGEERVEILKKRNQLVNRFGFGVKIYSKPQTFNDLTKAPTIPF